MKTLKEKFGELSAKIKASGQPARVWFPQYTPASLLSAENWWEALAVCEYALDTLSGTNYTHSTAFQMTITQNITTVTSTIPKVVANIAPMFQSANDLPIRLH